MAVTEQGLLFSWGAGTNGKLGHGDENDQPLPKLVEALKQRSAIVMQAEAGCEHSAAVTQDNDLYTWGHGDSGRLGHGENKTELLPKKVKVPSSTSVSTADAQDGRDVEVFSIAVGDKYNLILVSQDGEKDHFATKLL